MPELGNLLPTRVGLLIGFIVFLIVALLWQIGLFQAPELEVYDHFVLWHSDPAASDSRILIVSLTDKDIRKLDYPLRDSVLADLLDKIEGGRPSVVGLDLYRDLPEPRTAAELPLLNQAFLRYPNIVAIFLSNLPQSLFLIPPPPVLDTSRVAFNDFPFDYKTVRRAFLFLEDSSQTLPDKTHPQYQSFALALAYYYLATHNIEVSQEGREFKIGKTVFTQFQGSDGGYIHAPAGGYQFLQDFRGAQGFKTISVGDALALKDTSLFRDKIVLIGIAASSTNDAFTTPVADRAFGVVIHAQIVNQLLRAAISGDPPTAGARQPVEWIDLFGWCVVGVLVGWLVRSHIFFAFAITIGVGLIVLAAWILFLQGTWIIVMVPCVAFVTAATSAKAYAVNVEEAQRENMMKLLSQSVSSPVAQQMWRQRELFLRGGRPVAQRLTVTVLFTDLKNFSTISEGMAPDELIAWINECLSALARHVEKNSGIINNYMGDGMMAIFGVPIPRTTDVEIGLDASHAVRCAVEMGKEIKQLNARLRDSGRPEAGLRVGIFTGEAMAGTVGSADLLKYTVIGDTVNTASRLESVDKEEAMTGPSGDCRILIGEATFRHIKDQFRAHEVGALTLKGKSEVIKVYKVLD